MNKRIFIVEDDEAIASILRELLQSEGYIVQLAREGGEALEMLRACSELPACILLDLMMPGMDGYQFRANQEIDPRLALIPVVVMSADNQVESKTIRLGAKIYIRKPVELDEVLDVAARFSNSVTV